MACPLAYRVIELSHNNLNGTSYMCLGIGIAPVTNAIMKASVIQDSDDEDYLVSTPADRFVTLDGVAEKPQEDTSVYLNSNDMGTQLNSYP